MARIRPLLSPLLAAIATISVALVIANSYLSLRVFAGLPLGAVIADEYDDSAMIAHAISNMAVHDARRVVAIGGSSTREAFPRAPAYEKMLSKRLGQETLFYNLASSEQEFADDLLIVDALATAKALRRGDIILLSVSPRRFGAGAEETVRRYDLPAIPLLNGGVLKRFLLSQGVDVGSAPVLWRHRGVARSFIKGRIPSQVKPCLKDLMKLNGTLSCAAYTANLPFLSLREYAQYAYAPEPIPIDEKLRLARDVIDMKVPLVDLNADFSAALAREVVTTAAAHGAVTILLDLPRDPLSLAAYSSVEGSYARAITLLVEAGAYYLDLRESLPLPSPDFYDLDHVLPPQRAVVGDVVAASIGRLIESNVAGAR